jgi:hypothetical protein
MNEVSILLKKSDDSTPLILIRTVKYILPNFVVEWVTLLLRIREVPDSNLGPESG